MGRESKVKKRLEQVKWHQNLSFQARVFLSCFLVSLIPLICCGLVMLWIFTVSLNCQSVREGRQQLEDISIRFSQLFNNCEEACRNLAGDGSVARVMIDNTTIDIQKDTYLSLYQAVQEIYSHAEFSIYDAGGVLRFTTATSPREKQLPVHWGLLRKAAPNTGITYYRTDPYLSVTDKDILMQGAYSLENSHGARTGYVVLDFTKNNFDNFLQGYYSSNDTLLLLDSFLKPVYCSRAEYGEEQIDKMILQAIEGREESSEAFLWIREPSQGFYILLDRQAPISPSAIRTMGTVSLVLSVFSLIFCLMVSGALTKSITKPVRQLDRAMDQVKKGNLSICIHTSRRDELGRLTESFNQMTEDLKKYLEDAVQRQKDLNKAELKLYQTQLNPHFLYNTLDAIRWNARIHQLPEIAVMAEHLAVILRKSISSCPFVTLGEELEMIKSYIEIQRIRFTGHFLYETEIPYQLESCMIPKMILQPLVENAIIHGLEGWEKGYICIYAEQKEEILSISVTDDGRGMSLEMLQWINSPNPQKREGHLGLYNVIHILKLYYGSEYGVKAEVDTSGTTVTLMLPSRKEAPDV